MEPSKRKITGTILILISLGLFIFTPIVVSGIYGTILLIIGIIILLNQNEDKIEKAKKVKGGAIKK